MKYSNIAKNLLVAITLGVAAVASWAMTDFPVPAIETAMTQTTAG
jgi:hypothetical protein